MKNELFNLIRPQNAGKPADLNTAKPGTSRAENDAFARHLQDVRRSAPAEKPARPNPEPTRHNDRPEPASQSAHSLSDDTMPSRRSSEPETCSPPNEPETCTPPHASQTPGSASLAAEGDDLAVTGPVAPVTPPGESTSEIFAALHAALRGKLNGGQLRLIAQFVNPDLTPDQQEKLADIMARVERGEMSPGMAQQALISAGLYASFDRMVTFLENLRSSGTGLAAASAPDGLMEMANKILANLPRAPQPLETAGPVTSPAVEDIVPSSRSRSTLRSLAEMHAEKTAQPASPFSTPASHETEDSQVLLKFSKEIPVVSGDKRLSATPPAPEGRERLTSVLNDLNAEMNVAVKKPVKADVLTAAGKPVSPATALTLQAMTSMDGGQGLDDTALEQLQVNFNNMMTATARGGPEAPMMTATLRGSLHMAAAEQVAVQISKALKAGSDSIKINLNPSELGSLEVDLTVHKDGNVRAVVQVDKPETYLMLTRDMHGLQKALQDAGLEARSQDIQFNLRGDGQHHHQQTAQQQQTQSDVGMKSAMNNANDNMMMPELAMMHQGYASLADGRIDIRI